MNKPIDNPLTIGEEVNPKASMNISLWLDGYEDIFSDFDPRPFAERNISDDFLVELKKFSNEKESGISNITLLIPKNVRNIENEAIITKRLNQYFRKYYHAHLENKKKERKIGLRFIIIGICMMILSSYISLIKSDEFLMHTFFVLTEPAGWFILWTGLDRYFNSPSKTKPELTFYGKLIKSKISFIEY